MVPVGRGARTRKGESGPIGLDQAKQMVEAHIQAMDHETILLEQAFSRLLSHTVQARVSSPTDDVSLKDGFAVQARDTSRASETRPAKLTVVGTRFAGGSEDLDVLPGTAAKVTSGAILPGRADAVVGNEYCTEEGEEIRVYAPVFPGRNILPQGTDIRAGAEIGKRGDLLTPGRIGWMAAAGIERVGVYNRPRVALVATGDEVVAPGNPLKPGQLYASNLCTLSAWLAAFGIRASFKVLPDSREAIRRGLPRELEGSDVLMTSGGAWGSERDLVLKVLDELGWQKVFHRVRLGPGKAVGFGILQGKPVFCLPGGPPSNEVAFLQLALPGVLKMAGWKKEPFPCLEARLTDPLEGREISWTQIVRAKLFQDPQGYLCASPYKPSSRLESMARAECLIHIPEGMEKLEKGRQVRVQVLTPPGAFVSFGLPAPGKPEPEDNGNA